MARRKLRAIVVDGRRYLWRLGHRYLRDAAGLDDPASPAINLNRPGEAAVLIRQAVAAGWDPDARPRTVSGSMTACRCYSRARPIEEPGRAISQHRRSSARR